MSTPAAFCLRAASSVFAGRRGIRSKGTLTVTYVKAAPVVEGTADAVDSLSKLREVRGLQEAGVISGEDFEAKKAQLLAHV